MHILIFVNQCSFKTKIIMKISRNVTFHFIRRIYTKFKKFSERRLYKKNHKSTSVTVFEVKLDSIDIIRLKSIESSCNHLRQWLLEKMKIDEINYLVFSSPDSHFTYLKVYSWWYLSSYSWLDTGTRVVYYRKETC